MPVIIAVMAVLGMLSSLVPDETSPYNAIHEGGGRVLDVGDSHTWLTGVDRYRAWDVDALPGRPSGPVEGSNGGIEALELQLKPRHKMVVFDLATNDWDEAVDPAAYTTANLEDAWEMIGSRKLLLVTSGVSTRVSDSMEEGVAAVDQAIVQFARGKARCRVVFWHRVLARRQGLFSADGVHLTPEGYDLRLQTIKREARKLLRS